VLKDCDTIDIPAIEAELRDYVASSFLNDAQADGLRNDTDLFALLDSLQVLRLVVALETAFGFKVGDSELAPENLSSVERIARFVAHKRELAAVPVGQAFEPD
jgi:acyl carrier protein